MSKPDYSIHHRELPEERVDVLSKIGLEVRPQLDPSTFGYILSALISADQYPGLGSANIARSDGLGTAIECVKDTKLHEASDLQAIKDSEYGAAIEVAMKLARIIDPVGLLSIDFIQYEPRQPGVTENA